MFSDLGSVLIGFALFTTLFAVLGLWHGTARQDKRWYESGRQALYASTGLLLIALILLMIAFITNQFQVQYVAYHSNQLLPIHLKLSAIWAGQEGSLLLWAFLQVLFAALIAKRSKFGDSTLSNWATVFLTIIVVFFCAMTFFFSNPFVTISPVPIDGQGMNPLLRHPGMIFHPPVLYIGYVGLSVPFAFALASLIVGKVDAWPREVRNWLLMSWLFLGIGIFLGARWAYDVLGWGGYWGWDAVENAGLMPWLTATALLHGLVMQERGKGFKVWNVTLATLSFVLVLFGTFITRSGLIQSVHAFSRSQLGPYFLGMIGITLIGTLTMMILKRKAFGELEYPEKLFSREGAFFFTLLLLTLITLSILAGTLLPTLTDGRFAAPPAWFNRVVGPQFGALVLLMGVCPLFGRIIGAVKTSLWRAPPPLIGVVLIPTAAYLTGYDQTVSLIGFAVAGFAGGSALGEIGFNIVGRIKRNGHKKGLASLPVAGRHGYGGHLVHIGVILMAIGVIGTQMYSFEDNVTLLPGESAKVGDYTLVYEDLFQESAEDHVDTWASISVSRELSYLTTLEPQITYYPAYGQTMAEPAIRAGIGEDLYLVLFQWEHSGEISVSVQVNPLSTFLWIGGLILMIGGVLAWWPRKLGADREELKRQRIWTQIGAFAVIIVVIILLIALWGNSFGWFGKAERPLPGQIAPDFSAMDTGGEVLSLSDYRGQVVVINFWATWCPQCEAELLAFEAVWTDYQANGALFIGVAMDDNLTAVTEMASELQISFPLIVEEEGQITSAYGVTAVPETFIVDPEGNVAYFQIGVVNETQLRDELDVLLDRFD